MMPSHPFIITASPLLLEQDLSYACDSGGGAMVRYMLAFVAVVGVAANSGLSQEPVTLPVVSIPPAVSDSSLPAGTAVSRPLQPAMQNLPSQPIADVPSGHDIQIDSSFNLPSSWSRYDLLMWFPKSQPLPPLLLTSPNFSGVPAINSPTSTLLIGNRAIDNPMSTGGRFTWGWSRDQERDVGWEMTYLFTGTRSATAAYEGISQPRTLGRPVFATYLGQESSYFVSTAYTPGAFTATTVNRMQGWEVNGVASLGRSESSYVTILAGYRYFMIHEGVRMQQISTYLNLPGAVADSVDQFDGHTRFHGGQIGLDAGTEWNRFYVNVIGKVGFGRSYEVVKVGGQSNLTFPGGSSSINRGILTTQSNSGRLERSTFAVLPEGQLNVGYRFRDRSKFFVGYNVIYLSDAVRPGDQIDRTVSPDFVINTLPRPELRLTSTDFWVQGIVLGLEYKY
jgi:hypothetical protein